MDVLAEDKRDAPTAGDQEDMAQYLRDIRGFPLLNEQEERVLTVRCAQGDSDAIRLLVCSNLRLVVRVAREFSGRGVPVMDLVQDGSIALLSAAKKFDPSLGFRFSTYATKWIRWGIRRCLSVHCAMIRVPEYTTEKIQRILRAKAELELQLGYEPTTEMLSRHLQMETAQLAKFMEYFPQVSSLDEQHFESDPRQEPLGEELASPPQEQLVRDELRRVMEILLAQLTDRQRLILRLYFGMEDGECHSHESIGERIGLSKERVRQIKQQAMEQLRKNGAAFGLEDFLNE